MRIRASTQARRLGLTGLASSRQESAELGWDGQDRRKLKSPVKPGYQREGEKKGSIIKRGFSYPTFTLLVIIKRH